MSNGVPFYAIRIKGTELYKGSYDCFIPFEAAVGSGGYYNQLKTAEKNLKLDMERFHGGTKRYPTAIRYSTDTGAGVKYYAADQKYVDSQEYEIEFREIELEIVELRLTVA
jgi:hypothetical protein